MRTTDGSPGEGRAATEFGLDPEDWGAFADLGHRAVEDVFTRLARVREEPAWRPPPPESRAALAGALPLEPRHPAEVYAAFRRHIEPYSLGNTHPRFWGWVTGSGTAMGVLAELLTASLNTNVAGWDQAAASVENTVIRWMAEALGLPPESTGLLVGGGSAANLLGLAVARQSRSGFSVRELGCAHPEAPRLSLYGSTETHSCIQKAVELMGLGNQALRRIAVDARDRIRLDELARAHDTDVRHGLRPFCVVANAGTVNTGAVDDLETLALFCRERGLWLHVDGAFGALCALAPRARSLVRGLAQADSIAVDFHKWLHVPYDAGCILVREPGLQSQAFRVSPPYLQAVPRGPAALPFQFADAGMELSRSFRALKVWMTLSTYGLRALGELIDQNVEQARYLCARVARERELEQAGPADMNVVCLRWVGQGGDGPVLDAVNREILLRIQESGFAVPSSTVREGRFCLRVALANHRTRRGDLDAFVDRVLALGRALSNPPKEEP